MKALAVGFALSLGCAPMAFGTPRDGSAPPAYDAVIAKHAQANGVPEALVRRVIVRESRYNPRARNRSFYGMMQISAATARSMGYRGAPDGLLDADVNLTYAVRYLAGAYRTAGGDHDRAMRFYARGYYYDAKRKGLLAAIGLGRDGRAVTPPPGAAGPVLAVAQTQPIQVAAPVPTPPVRAAAPVATVALSPAPSIPLPQPRDAIGAPRGGPALAASALVPPSRDVATTGSIAAKAPLPPVRPASEPAPQLAAAAPLPTPRDAQAAKPAAGARVIPIDAQPALASAGPALPVKRAPTPAARPSAEPAALAYAGQPREDAAAAPLKGMTPLPPRR